MPLSARISIDNWTVLFRIFSWTLLFFSLAQILEVRPTSYPACIFDSINENALTCPLHSSKNISSFQGAHFWSLHAIPQRGLKCCVDPFWQPFWLEFLLWSSLIKYKIPTARVFLHAFVKRGHAGYITSDWSLSPVWGDLFWFYMSFWFVALAVI